MRRATPQDIDRLIEIRGGVTENRLSDPASVTRDDYARFVAAGRVWVTEADGRVVGFAAGEGRDGTIWALFIDPDHQRAGFGSALLRQVCADLAADGYRTVGLTTQPGTAAEAFYRRRGWTALGLTGRGEMRFARSLGGSDP